MSVAAGSFDPAASPRRRAVAPARHPLVTIDTPGERFRLMILWMTLLGSALVIAEPSPYEVGVLIAVIVFMSSGSILLRPVHMPLAFILVVYCLGLSISSVAVLWQKKVLTWTLVSWYLAVTAIFFAAIVTENTERRINAIMRGWTAAALLAGLCGIIGYFRLVPGAFDLFTLYGRAKGTFNDPNVLAPFLIAPMLVAIQVFFSGSFKAMAKASVVLAVTLCAMLLTFSRGGWMHLALSGAVMVFLLFVTSQSSRERLRIIILVMVAVLLFATLIGVLLSVDSVATLMRERANLSQSYDSGPMGRFGRHIFGWQLALEEPLGIGPLQFASRFTEDTHNAYLNSFMAGGWISGVTYPAIVAMTTIVGLINCFQRTPWQKTSITLFSAFFGLAVLGFIIDSEHWRHFWVLMGLIFGLGLANRLALSNPIHAPGHLAVRRERA
ncbi:MAG: O-antigen ligase family protein [Alphaproteobacteria bacterium]